MPQPPFAISAEDPKELINQIQLLMGELYEERIGGAITGDVFSINDSDILTLDLAAESGLEKISNKLKVKLDGSSLKLSANGLSVDAVSYDVVIQEGDANRADNSAAALYIDFNNADFDVGVVGNECNITVNDSGINHDATYNRIHDGDTLQCDGINSNGGAFAFTTSGPITTTQNIGDASNNAIGLNAGNIGGGGSENTCFGENAGKSIGSITGFLNVYIGKNAGRDMVNAYYNVFVGASAGSDGSLGHGNVVIGFEAGKIMGTLGSGGYANTLIGYKAGDSITTGYSNILIGYGVDVTGAADHKLNIGNILYGDLSTNKIGIGVEPINELTVAGRIDLSARAAAGSSFLNYGQIWVKNTTPNELWFTDDAGNDSQLTGGMSESLWLPFNALKAPGTKPAEFKEWGISGVWEFSDGTDDTIVFNIQTPYDMDINVAPSLLIGWSTSTTVTTKTAVWQLEYLWTSEGEDTTAAAQGTLTVNSNAVAQANGLIFAEITGIDLPSATDVCMHCRVKRLGADPADDLTDTAEVHGVCFKYTSS